MGKINWDTINISLAISIIVFGVLTIFLNFFESGDERFNLKDLEENVGYSMCSKGFNTEDLICERDGEMSMVIPLYNISVEKLNEAVKDCDRLIVSKNIYCEEEIFYYDGEFQNERN